MRRSLKKTEALILLAVLLALVPVLPVQATESVSLDIGGSQFELEVVADPLSRFQGLSDRQALAADQGMLFVYPAPGSRAFVMRRCLFPIDIIFLDSEGRILATHAMQVEPYDTPERDLTHYPSGPGMQYAIELVGGTVARLELKAGDQLTLTDQVRGIKPR